MLQNGRRPRWSTRCGGSVICCRAVVRRGARYLPDTDTVEFVAGVDQGAGRAIFSSMAGALTGNKMQIMAAETNTLADGLLADALRGVRAGVAG